MKLELKRVLKTRLNIGLILFALFLSLVMAYLPATFPRGSYLDEEGNIVKVKGMEYIAYEKEVQAGISGEVTTEKVRNALEKYQESLTKYGVKESYDLPDGVYGTEILPHDQLLPGLRKIFANPKVMIAPSLMEIQLEDTWDYYEAAKNSNEVIVNYEQSKHPAAAEAGIKLYNKVEKPFYYYPGYNSDALDYQMFLAFLILCLCVIIAVPVFASDYQTGADDILRCTKHGRVRLAAVKILSSFLICTSIFVICELIYILVSNSLFGWETTKTSMQMIFSVFCLPNMNIMELQVFNGIAYLLSMLATISFILLISSRCKNMVISLGLSFVVCMLPVIVYAVFPSGIRDMVNCLIPSSGVGYQASMLYVMMDFAFLSIGNLALWVPYVMLGAYLVEIPLFTAGAIYSYIKPQNVS